MRWFRVLVIGTILAAAALESASDRSSLAVVSGPPEEWLIDSSSPRPRGKLRVAVIGDFGDGTDAQAALGRRMCTWRRRHPFSIVLATGDNIYPDGSAPYFQSRFLEPYECLHRQGVQWHAVLGNHDVMTDNGAPQLNTPVFGMRGRNYLVRRKHVRMVFADSNQLDMGWLRRALKTKRGNRWTIVILHHPVYSAGHHFPTPGFIPRLPRLFERRGVDLVLTGHDHLYSESRPLNGIRYVVTGAGGGETHDCITRSFVKSCHSRTHFLYLTAGPRRIQVRAVDSEGEIFARVRTSGLP
jgi:acid phosphatase